MSARSVEVARGKVIRWYGARNADAFYAAVDDFESAVRADERSRVELIGAARGDRYQ